MFDNFPFIDPIASRTFQRKQLKTVRILTVLFYFILF